MLINFANILNVISTDEIRVPESKSIYFCGLIWPFKWVLEVVFCFFSGTQLQSDLISHCHPQVKLKGREPAGFSLAHYWVSTQKLPTDGPRPQQGYTSDPSPMGWGFGVFTMVRDSSVGGNFALQAVNYKVKRNGAKGRQEKKPYTSPVLTALQP